jgi:hypothetical protein
MANTTPDNIYYPVASDQITDLNVIFANQANSVQNALNRHTYKPADITALNALTGMLPGDLALVLSTYTMFMYTGSTTGWVPAGGPYARAVIPAGTVTAGTWAPLALSSPVASNFVTWSSGSPTRLTVNYKGRYRVTGNVVVGTTGTAQGRINVNGATNFEVLVGSAAGVGYPATNGDVNLPAGGYVEMQAVAGTTSTYGGELSLTWLSATL